MGIKETRAWFEGCKAGNKMVIDFLKEMKMVDIEEEFVAWCNADEYIDKNGDIIKRYA